MANGADPLAEFYVATQRQSPGLTGRSGVHGRVDGLLGGLNVPAEVDKDGDWKLTTDVGPFLLIVDKDGGDLVALQTIQQMEKVKKASEEMYVLLALNFEARGLARFGTVKDGGQDLLVLTARLAPEAISSEALEGMLADCFRLSRRVDELLGNEPPQPAADAEPPPAGEPPAPQPPPGGPAEEPGEAAVTVFGQAPLGPPSADAALDFPPPVVAEPAPGPAQPVPASSYPPPAAEPAQSYPPPSVPEPIQQYQPPQPPVALPVANWYPDPYYQARLRYWDGQSWTQHVAN